MDRTDLGEPLSLDRDKCALCFQCVDACPSKVLIRVGREMGLEEIVAKIVPYKSLFDSTGGGATFSGGEPTLFMIIPRTPLIPGLIDTEDNMRGLLGFYLGNGISQAALAKNNPIWLAKSEKIGENLHILHDSPMRVFL